MDSILSDYLNNLDTPTVLDDLEDFHDKKIQLLKEIPAYCEAYRNNASIEFDAMKDKLKRSETHCNTLILIFCDPNYGTD